MRVVGSIVSWFPGSVPISNPHVTPENLGPSPVYLCVKSLSGEFIKTEARLIVPICTHNQADVARVTDPA
jgi:hypothetical protein